MNKKFISLAKFPGKVGNFFYNYFFKKYNLDYTYTSIGCDSIESYIVNFKNFSGISISMPYKTAVVPYLNYCDDLVKKYKICNTVKVVDNFLYGYNTDYFGVKYILTLIQKNDRVSLLGDGAMARIFSNSLLNYDQYSRKLNNWNLRDKDTDVIINCTAIGTSVDKVLFSNFPKSRLLIDLSFNNSLLRDEAESNGTKYISGLQFYKFVFLEQFKIYTKIELHSHEFDSAALEFKTI